MPPNASRDENFVTTLLAVSNVDGSTPVKLYADPVTHRLLVSVIGTGATGINSQVSNAAPSVNTDTTRILLLTAQAVDVTSVTVSGSPIDGQQLQVAITGTAARAITWGTSFEASTVALPTTTVLTNRLDVFFTWNSATSKWRCISAV